MSEVYFNSSDLLLYPANSRSDTHDRFSKLNIEHNLINVINRLTGKDSFIVSGLEFSASGNNITIQPGVFNIHGYLVEMRFVNTCSQTGSVGDCICFKIRVRNKTITDIDSHTYTRQELLGVDGQPVSDSTDDATSVFNGLTLCTVTPDVNGNLSVANGIDGSQYFLLPVATKTSSGWTSIYNNDGVGTNRAYLQKYDVNQISIKFGKTFNKYSDTEQDLLTFLKNNYTIDDGEVL